MKIWSHNYTEASMITQLPGDEAVPRDLPAIEEHRPIVISIAIGPRAALSHSFEIYPLNPGCSLTTFEIHPEWSLNHRNYWPRDQLHCYCIARSDSFYHRNISFFPRAVQSIYFLFRENLASVSLEREYGKLCIHELKAHLVFLLQNHGFPVRDPAGSRTIKYNEASYLSFPLTFSSA